MTCHIRQQYDQKDSSVHSIKVICRKWSAFISGSILSTSFHHPSSLPFHTAHSFLWYILRSPFKRQRWRNASLVSLRQISFRAPSRSCPYPNVFPEPRFSASQVSLARSVRSHSERALGSCFSSLFVWLCLCAPCRLSQIPTNHTGQKITPTIQISKRKALLSRIQASQPPTWQVKWGFRKHRMNELKHKMTRKSVQRKEIKFTAVDWRANTAASPRLQVGKIHVQNQQQE